MNRAANVNTPPHSRERQWALYLEHPDTCPELIGMLDYLIHPPSKLSSNGRWIDFRDRTLLPMLAGKPDDPNPGQPAEFSEAG
jgi:hypothetical protein